MFILTIVISWILELLSVFLGYSPTQKGYKCYDPTTHKVFISLHVTFFENTPYFLETSLQGEKSREVQFLSFDLNASEPEPVLSSSNPPPNPPPNPSVSFDSEILKDMGVNNPGEDTARDKELRVYSRRPKVQHREDLTLTAPRELNPVIAPNDAELSSPDSLSEADLSLPIALRKQPRSCTLHPISKFVSYNALSAKFRTFTSSLDREKIPRDVQEALKVPEWRKAVIEEMNALEKNGT